MIDTRTLNYRVAVHVIGAIKYWYNIIYAYIINIYAYIVVIYALINIHVNTGYIERSNKGSFDWIWMIDIFDKSNVIYK
jgi:hypothetical protein